MDEEIENPLRITLFVVLVVLLLGIYLNQYWVLYSAMGFLGLALLFRTVNTYFARGWMKLARILGTVNSKLILTLLFYLVLTPIALLSRLFRSSPVIRTPEGTKRDTYWNRREKQFERDDFEKPW